MSKEGAKRRQEHTKPRNRSILDEREGVIGKTCTKCNEWKGLYNFHKDSKGTGGRHSRCKDCASKGKGYKTKRQPTILEDINGIIGKSCTKCNAWKSLDYYGRNPKGIGYRDSQCKSCAKKYRDENKEHYREYRTKNREKLLEDNKQWRVKNLEYLREYREKSMEREIKYRDANRLKYAANARKWAKENREKVRINNQNRRARTRALPNDWNVQMRNKTWEHFNDSCALTGSPDNTVDHAIPIAIGHGGTTYGNLYPLQHSLNISKKDSNIFEWFEANRQRFELSQERFDRLIAYLASANAMTVEEYRAHVDWCHENPRSIDELEAK
jgi:hypothetical protein